MPGHIVRLVTTQIPDPQAWLKPFPVLPQGMSRRVRGWGLWPIRVEGDLKAALPFCQGKQVPRERKYLHTA